MAAHVLRLRIALLLGALRGDAAHMRRTTVGLLLLVAATAAVSRATESSGEALSVTTTRRPGTAARSAWSDRRQSTVRSAER